MSFIQTKNVFDHITEFKNDICEFLQTRLNLETSVRSRMLHTYSLNWHKKSVEEVEEFGKRLDGQLLETWIQFRPECLYKSFDDYLPPIKSFFDSDQIIDANIEWNKHVITLYEDVHEATQSQLLKEAFSLLKAKELTLRNEMVNCIQEFQQIL